MIKTKHKFLIKLVITITVIFGHSVAFSNDDLFDYPTKKMVTNADLAEYRKLYLENISSQLKGSTCDMEKVTNHGTSYINGVRRLLNDAPNDKATKDKWIEEAVNTDFQQRNKCAAINEPSDCTKSGGEWDGKKCKKLGESCTESHGDGIGTYQKDPKQNNKLRCKLKECRKSGYVIDEEDDRFSCSIFDRKGEKTDEELNAKAKKKERNEKLEQLKVDFQNKSKDYCDGALTATSGTYKDSVNRLLNIDYKDVTSSDEKQKYQSEANSTIKTFEKKCCENKGNIWIDNTCKGEYESCTESRGDGIGTYRKDPKQNNKLRCKLKECRANGYVIDGEDDGFSCSIFDRKGEKTRIEMKTKELKESYITKTNNQTKSSECNLKNVKRTGEEYQRDFNNAMAALGKDVSQEKANELKTDMDSTIATQEAKCQAVNDEKKCADAGDIWEDNQCKTTGSDCTKTYGKGIGKYEKTDKGWKCKLSSCEQSGYDIDSSDDGHSCTIISSKKEKSPEEKLTQEFEKDVEQIMEAYRARKKKLESEQKS